MQIARKQAVSFEPGDLLIFNFRQKKFEFRPGILDIKFGKSAEDEPIVNVFYGLDVMRKMMWIAKYLAVIKRQADIIYVFKDDDHIVFQISIALSKFPVGDFAQALKVPQIIDKEIDSMAAEVSSIGLVTVTDKAFYPVFTKNPDWQVSLVGVNLDTKQVVNNFSVGLPVKVAEKKIKFN